MLLGGGRPRLFLCPGCRVRETLLFAGLKGVCHSLENVNLEHMGVNLWQLGGIHTMNMWASVCPGVRDAAIILSWGASQQESSYCSNLSQTICCIAAATALAHSAQANCATPSSPDPKRADQGGLTFLRRGRLNRGQLAVQGASEDVL